MTADRRLIVPVVHEQPGKKAPLDPVIWMLAGGLFVISLSFGIISPALPLFAGSFGVGTTAVTLVVSVFALARLLGGSVAGPVVSRFGARAVYVWGILVVGVGTGLCAVVAAYWQLLLFRGLAGIGSSVFTVAASVLFAELAPADQRARAAGLMTTAGMLGSIGGPLVGSMLVQVNLRMPFLAYAGLMITVALVAARLLGTVVAARPETTAGQDKSSMAGAMRHPTYRAALAANFAVYGWAASGLQAGILPLYLAELRAGDPALVGVTLSVFATGTVLMLPISGRLADSRGRKPVALTGLAVSVAATVALGLAGSATALIVASFIAGAGAGLLSPPNSAAVTDIVGLAEINTGSAQPHLSRRRRRRRRGDQSGTVLAGYQMAAAAGSILGPPALGILTTLSSYRVGFFVTAAIIATAALAWLFARETAPCAATNQAKP